MGFWIYLYKGMSSSVLWRIAGFHVILWLFSYIGYVVLKFTFSRKPYLCINFEYLLFTVYFALPVYLFYTEKLVNRQFGNIITTNNILGILSTGVIALLIIVFYQVIYNLFKRSGKVLKMTVNLLVISITFLLPIFVRSPQASVLSNIQNTSPLCRITEERKGSVKGRTVVLGLDGATWEVMLPLISAGKLPNIERLLENGVGGILNSSEPSRSPVVWTSIFTGFSPEQHGIDSWETSLSTNRRVKSLWNIFNEYLKKCVVLNVPGTYPPEVTQSLMISGFPIPEATINNLGWFFSTEMDPTIDIPQFRLIFEKTEDADHDRMAEIALPLIFPNEIQEYIVNPDEILTDKYCLYNFFIEFLIKKEIKKPVEKQWVKLNVSKSEGNESVQIINPDFPQQEEVSLEPGDWSPPIYLNVDESKKFIKVKLVKNQGHSTSIYISPLFNCMLDLDRNSFGIYRGDDFGKVFLDEYIIEGPGWGEMNHPDIIQAFWELQKYVSDSRADLVNSLFREKEWDIFISVYTMIDRIQHSFWKYKEPDHFKNISEENIELFRETIDQTYIETDKKLSAIIDGLEENDLLVVVSDHGFQKSDNPNEVKTSGRHKKTGIFIFHGRGVQKMYFDPENFLESDIYQITPTILYLSGLAVGEDMKGSLIKDVIDRKYLVENPIEFIPSYDFGLSSIVNSKTIDESTREKLKSLGYIH